MRTTTTRIIVGIGLLLGAVFAVAAFVTGVPLAALVVITAVAGAHALIAGILVLLGQVAVSDLGDGVASAIIMTNAGWWLLALALIDRSASGMISAGRSMPRRGWFQRSNASRPTSTPLTQSTCG